MKRKWIKTGFIALAATASGYLTAGPPTPAPEDSQVQTHIRLEVDKETDMVHFVNTNNDPDVITKTYVLKHADPYELRPYLRTALRRRVNDRDVKCEAVKYNDGTGILIVSAEDYKFDKAIQNGGMTIDEIITMLDLPKVTSSSGKGKFLYFPKHRTARELADLLEEVGMSVANSVQENQRGKDEAFIDTELNAIWFYITNWSIKYINDMLEVYDQPLPEVKVAYKIFEIDHENDAKIGADWQAWKNGPGSDFFTAASRYSRGWDFSNSVPGLPWVKDSNTNFLKFSPRWNSRFLDLVAAQGKASVLTEGQLSMVNGREGRIEALTQFPSFVPGAANNSIVLNEYVRYTNAAVAVDGNGIQITTAGGANFSVFPVNSKGNPVSVNVAAANQNIMITRAVVGTKSSYTMELQASRANRVGAQFIALGDGDIGLKVSNLSGDFGDLDDEWQADWRYQIDKDNGRDTQINDLDQGDAFGFRLRMIPSVCGQTTSLDIDIYNTSLIGFQNDGTPRTERSEYNTKVMLSNSGSKFVIGGIEKKSSINSVSKLPWLGSLPLIGWLLGSESSVGKNSRIVSVLECVPVQPNTTVPASIEGDVKTIGKDTKDVGDGLNKIGFDQFHLDKEKRSLMPLP